MSVVLAVWAWWQAQWPGIYPNLIAAAIQGAAVYLWARRHVRRIHTRLDRVHEHLTQLKGGTDGAQGN